MVVLLSGKNTIDLTSALTTFMCGVLGNTMSLTQSSHQESYGTFALIGLSDNP